MAAGKTGYCSLCRHEKVKELNAVIAAGGSYNAALEEMAAHDWRFSKATFFKHKSHSTSALLTDAENARKKPIVPQSNKAVLEAIRDLGMRKALEDPDSVTVNQALRAAAILADKESKRDNIQIILAKALQIDASPQVEMIEGEFSELPLLNGGN